MKAVRLIRKYPYILIAIFGIFFLSAAFQAAATPPVSPYIAGETLDPTCAPGDANCYVTPISIGTFVGNGTSGSIPFIDSSGELAEDNTALFWDETNDRLGIGTNTPAATLDIATFVGTASSVGAANNLGTGINDLTSSGNYTGINPDTLYVYVDTLGAPDKFTYTSDTGIYVGVSLDIVSGPIYIGDGVYIEFGSDTGHDGSEFWEIVLTPAIVTSSSGDLNIGGSYFKNGMRWGGAIGGRIDDAQSSGVLFSGTNKTLSQDATNFAWNDATNRLSVMNISLPASASSSEGVIFKNGSSFLHTYRVDSGSNQNLFIGSGAGNFSLTASGVFENANVGIGPNALRLLTSGYFNTATGANALEGNTSGIENTGVGLQAGRNNRTGSFNVAVGSNALFGVGGLSSSNNTAVGALALNIARGNNNIALGYSAADNLTTGTNNIFIGYDIEAQSPTSANTLSIGNLIFGTGIDGTGSTVSSGNIGIGDASPDFRLDVEGNTSGAAIASFFNDGNNTDREGIVIFAGVDDHTAASTSTLASFRDGDGTVVGSITFGSSVTAFNTTSDERLKDNIVDTDISIDDLMDIQVRDFTWRADKDDKVTHGFIAQELYDVYPGAVTLPAKEGGYWMVDYSKLMPLTIKALQDVQFEIQDINDLSDDSEGGFVHMLREWLASAANGIQNIFAKKVTTEELCLEDICITKAELIEMMSKNNMDVGSDEEGVIDENINSDDTGAQDESGESGGENIDIPPDESQDIPDDVSDEGGPDIESGDEAPVEGEVI